jgi:ubiquinone/menaquinone biosynthesis C-methylase UbiE
MSKPEADDPHDLGALLFKLQADLNFTRHLGGQTATDQLVELCEIDPNKHVLDVGCGVGITPHNLVKSIGCRVTAIDLRFSMIRRARERATRQRLDLAVADVQDLPFRDDQFDVVLAESVLAFVPDKSRAVRECLRALKPGGFLGVTEATWMEAPPPRLVKQLSDTFGPGFAVLDSEGWQGLLRQTGVRDLVATSRRITARSESSDRLRRLGFKQLVRVWLRAASLSLRSSEYRSLPRGALSDPRELIDYWGCGVYVGRKQSVDEKREG